MEELVNWLIKTLKQHGFIIQRYDSKTTNSVYLKLDYGVANSIRISDHKGKQHLSYRYNLLTNITESYVENGQYPKYYYSPNDIEQMIADIIKHKQERLKTYGERNYKRIMEKNIRENSQSQGFWKLAVKV